MSLDLKTCLNLTFQVESNDPNALYRLVQKERELKFPFTVSVDGEIALTEELDREEKDLVKHNTLLNSRGREPF